MKRRTEREKEKAMQQVTVISMDAALEDVSTGMKQAH